MKSKDGVLRIGLMNATLSRRLRQPVYCSRFRCTVMLLHFRKVRRKHIDQMLKMHRRNRCEKGMRSACYNMCRLTTLEGEPR